MFPQNKDYCKLEKIGEHAPYQNWREEVVICGIQNTNQSKLPAKHSLQSIIFCLAELYLCKWYLKTNIRIKLHMSIASIIEENFQ